MKSREIEHYDLSSQEPTKRADPVIRTEPAGAEPWGAGGVEEGRDEEVPPAR